MAVCETGDYKVSFGRTAFTLVYEDAVGILLFTFDFNPAEKNEPGKKSNLYLNKGALIKVGERNWILYGGSLLERERFTTAQERVKQYCALCGYVVLMG